MWVALQKLLTFSSTNISIYARFKDRRFNNTLTNDIVSTNGSVGFEQLGPVFAWHGSFLQDLLWLYVQMTRFV